MLRITLQTVLLLLVSYASAQLRPNSYAHILQDTRNEPTPDGNFGYLYKTEDGIVSSARGDPTGKIQGTFSYTDPTGLKVNINYNAGSRFDRRRNEEVIPDGKQGNNNYYKEEEDDGQYREEYQQGSYYSPQDDDYYQPQYNKQKPRSRGYNEDAGVVYQQRRTRTWPKENEVNNNNYY